MTSKTIGQQLRETEASVQEMCRILHIDRQPYDYGPELTKNIALGIADLLAEKRRLENHA